MLEFMPFFRVVDIQDYIYYQLIALGCSWPNAQPPVDRDYLRIIVLVFFGWVLTHCGRVTQICVFNTVKLGTSASSP
jgi:hypothetical protein